MSLRGNKTLLGNLLSFFAAIVISAAIIPLMIRWAPRLGMVDIPDPRKVHTSPIPRVGGIGIVIGAIIPVFLWVPLDASLHAYLFGSLVLLAFGVAGAVGIFFGWYPAKRASLLDPIVALRRE